MTPTNNRTRYPGFPPPAPARPAPAPVGRIYRSGEQSGTDGASPSSSTGPRRGGAGGNRGTRRASRGRRIALISGAVVMILLGLTGIGAYVMMSKMSGNVGRIDNAFDGLNEELRPTKSAANKNSQTFLLLGSDSRDAGPASGRTDTIMMAHIPNDRSSAQIVSVPRDSWVDIPGKGKMKINAAYALGGPSLLIQTVETLTKVRIDHFAIVDFAGFKSIIDAIGGVDVEVSEATTDLEGNRFHTGVNHLDGKTALAYVRQRYGLQNGDFDRVKRQQNLLRAVMTKMGSFDPASNPIGSYKLLDSVTKSISVDDRFTNGEMRSLATKVPAIRSGGITFLTVPTKGTGMEGSQSVVYLDAAKSGELWNAVRADSVPAYASANSKDLLPATPR